MNGEERRKGIIETLTESKTPVSGTVLAEKYGVSRQVVVQDIALIRAKNICIDSTNRGYVLRGRQEYDRVFKVYHTDEEVEKELNLIVDMGGKIKNVFVYHRVYGVIKAEMEINSRRDVVGYMANLKSGCSTFLKNVTSGYHYHTVAADREEVLDLIQQKLDEEGFLAELQEFEPLELSAKKEENQ